MDFFEVLQLLRRRWPVIVLVTLTGLVAGYVTAPGEGTRDVRYSATTTLLANPQSTTGVNLRQAALLTTTGSVPTQVAADLGLEDPDAARRGVSATPDTETGSVEVKAVRDTAARAEEVSAAFANELVETLTGNDRRAYDEQLAQLNERVQQLQSEVDLTRLASLESPEDEATAAALSAAQSALTQAQTERSQFQSQGPPQSSLLIVEEGEGREVEPEGVRAPDGKLERGLLLGVFGLLLGAGAAFALDRLDTKIRNKATAEAALGHPVLAEIPPLPGGRKHRDELLALTQPSSPFVEAYRGLRTVVVLTAEHSSSNGSGKHGTVLVVTSPGAGEGKTTTAAHLAAMLAEVGRSVLVVSADLRRPRLHVLFGTDREPGLTEMLANEGEAPDLAALVKSTKMSRVRLLPSGAPTENPAPLLRQAADVLAAARQVFDFVIVDTPPLLVANDAAELASSADGVLVIARATRTSIDAAQRSAEMLDRLDTPVIGCVLAGATDTPTAYSYYRSRYYSETERRGLRRSTAAGGHEAFSE